MESKRKESIQVWSERRVKEKEKEKKNDGGVEIREKKKIEEEEEERGHKLFQKDYDQ